MNWCRRLRATVLLMLLCTVAACQRQTMQIEGATMGSRYHITYVQHPQTADIAQITAQVQDVLDTVDKAVSTYRDDSALAQFNALPAGQCMAMPAAARTMMDYALQLGEQSQGTFDVSLLPALRAWGFGPEQIHAIQAEQQALPSSAAVAQLRSQLGQHHVRVENDALCKDADVQIEFNSIAAGYAIDEIATRLQQLGASDFLINVTGEMRAQGRRADGNSWQVAIEAPLEHAVTAQKIIPLSDKAISTSGDYRAYREVAGQRYSHVIDPRTLQPVTHALASVTVLDTQAISADGLSTLLMVLGPEQGLAYAQQHQIAAFFIIRTDTGFETRSSPAFAALFAAPAQ